MRWITGVLAGDMASMKMQSNLWGAATLGLTTSQCYT